MTPAVWLADDRGSSEPRSPVRRALERRGGPEENQALSTGDRTVVLGILSHLPPELRGAAGFVLSGGKQSPRILDRT